MTLCTRATISHQTGRLVSLPSQQPRGQNHALAGDFPLRFEEVISAMAKCHVTMSVILLCPIWKENV